MASKTPLAAAALLLLAACGRGQEEAGAVSAGEASELNDAAAMLDANSVDANAVSIDGENEAQPQ